MDAVLENQHYCVEKHHNRCGPWREGRYGPLEGGEGWSMGGREGRCEALGGRGGVGHGREGRCGPWEGGEV